jgi:release factor glutamine methyltransferase
MHKLSDLLSQAKKALAPIGASHEARIMAGRAFLMTDAQLLLKRDEEIAKEQAERFWGMVEERLSGTPLQYVLGEWEFMGLPMKVQKGVLIPRFDTEIAALRAIEWMRASGAKCALDLCCGSGCIAVALVKNTGASVTASDVSPTALAVTRENAELNGVSDRVKVVSSDLFENITEKFDLIVSNPPYIPKKDIDGLDKEVREHEPMLALCGGEDGLDFYRRIAFEAPNFLKNGGKLVLEVGINQSKEVEKLLAEAGLEKIQVIRDLSGVERVVEGCLPEDR